MFTILLNPTRHSVSNRHIRHFFAARLCLFVYPFSPYVLLYALHYGVDLSAALLAEAIFDVVTIILDVPCGRAADRMGRIGALSLAGCVQLACCVILVAFPSAMAFWLTQPLWGIAAALGRGADASVSHDLLEQYGAVELFEEMERTYQVLYNYASAVVFAGSIIVVRYGYKYVFLETAILQVIAVSLLISLQRSQPRRVSPLRNLERSNTKLRSLVADVMNSPSCYIRLFALVLFGTALITLSFYMPALLTACGMPGVYIGPTFALAGVSAGVISTAATRRRFPISGLSVAIAAFGIGSFFTHNPLLVFVGYVSCLVAQISVVPEARKVVLAALPNRGKAEALSLVTFAGSVGFAVIAPMLSLVIKTTGIEGLAFMCSGLFVGSWIVLQVTKKYDLKLSS